MADPIEFELTDSMLNRALEWAKLSDVPAGKERFKAIRTTLRDYLQDQGRAPSAAKDFLSESLITKVGRSGNPSELPRDLRRMLGSGAQDFANELTFAYHTLSGKAPAGTNKVFKTILGEMEKAGMAPADVAAIRKMGLEGISQGGGLGRALSGLTKAKSDPATARLLRWGVNLFGAKKAPPVPVPQMIQEAAAAFKPSEATYAQLSKAGVKGTGVVGRLARSVSAPLAAGQVGLYALSTFREDAADREQAAQMAATGVIPDELGGQSQTAAAFMREMANRQDALKKARFQAVTQEQDLTNEVVAALQGGQDEPSLTKRFKLGSLRPTPSERRSSNEVSSLFDQLLEQTMMNQ